MRGPAAQILGITTTRCLPINPKLAPADLKATVARLGLDRAKFAAGSTVAAIEEAIQRDAAGGASVRRDGNALVFFIDGRPLTGAQPQSEFEGVIHDELARSSHAQARAEVIWRGVQHARDDLTKRPSRKRRHVGRRRVAYHSQALPGRRGGESFRRRAAASAWRPSTASLRA